MNTLNLAPALFALIVGLTPALYAGTDAAERAIEPRTFHMDNLDSIQEYYELQIGMRPTITEASPEALQESVSRCTMGYANFKMRDPRTRVIYAGRHPREPLALVCNVFPASPTVYVRMCELIGMELVQADEAHYTLTCRSADLVGRTDGA